MIKNCLLKFLVLLFCLSSGAYTAQAQEHWTCTDPAVIQKDLTNVSIEGLAQNGFSIESGSFKAIPRTGLVGGEWVDIRANVIVETNVVVQLYTPVSLPSNCAFLLQGAVDNTDSILLKQLNMQGNLAANEAMAANRARHAIMERLKEIRNYKIASGITLKPDQDEFKRDVFLWQVKCVSLQPVCFSNLQLWITLPAGTKIAITAMATRGSTPYQWESLTNHGWGFSISQLTITNQNLLPSGVNLPSLEEPVLHKVTPAERQQVMNWALVRYAMQRGKYSAIQPSVPIWEKLSALQQAGLQSDLMFQTNIQQILVDRHWSL